MTITFRIQYHTNWGESLRVLMDDGFEVELSTVDGIQWQGQSNYQPASDDTPVPYRYAVYRDNQCIRREFGAIPHLFCPSPGRQCHYLLQDTWRDLPAASYRFSSAFRGEDAFMPGGPLPYVQSESSVIFRVLCPSGVTKRRVLALSRLTVSA